MQADCADGLLGGVIDQIHRLVNCPCRRTLAVSHSTAQNSNKPSSREHTGLLLSVGGSCSADLMFK